MTEENEKLVSIEKQVQKVIADTDSLIELQELLTLCLENLKSFEDFHELENYENYLVLKRAKVLVKTYALGASRQLEDMYAHLLNLKKLVV
jgi:SPX domain protein involved in polyphosphate accumulation